MKETVYTPERVEELSKEAARRAMEHFRHGLNCAECVVQAFIDLGISSYDPSIVGLVSGMGGGMAHTGHTCGAVNAGLVVVSAEKGRKNPYGAASTQERIAELNAPETGVYARHGAYLRECFAQLGTIECRDLCIQYRDFASRDRARNCRRIIGLCAAAAVRHALKG